MRDAFRALTRGVDQPMVLVDDAERVVAHNGAAHMLTGIRGAATPPRLTDVLKDTQPLRDLLTAAWKSPEPVGGAAEIRADDEGWRCWGWRFTMPDAPDNAHVVLRLRPQRAVVERFDALNDKIDELAEEIHRRRGVEDTLRRVLDETAAVFGHAPIGMAVAEVEHIGAVRFLQVNPAMVALTGHTAAAFTSLSLETLVHSDHFEASATAIAQLLLGEAVTTTFETALRRADGEYVWVAIKASLLGDDPHRLVLQMVDMTESRQHEAQLRHLADHDPLTNLANRRRFEEDLRTSLAHARRYSSPAALLIIDLDNFKGINDTHGHAAGDDILRRVADVLRSRLRETDIVARLGGDEFAVVLSHTGPDDAVKVADDLRTAIRERSAITAGGELLRTSATIGVAPVAAGTDVAAEQLLVQADVAMYDAKSSGGDRVATVDPSQDGQHRVQAEHRWIERIRDALDNDGFVMVMQPILDLRERRVNRCELLLRMDGKQGDLIPPAAFMHIAERFGLIQAIDRWVVQQAVRVLADWQAHGCNYVLEVNVSGASMTDPAVIQFIEQQVNAVDVDATRLVFEITETAAIVNITQARAFADRLILLGCQFALDDFGSGFGSFYYLKHFPTSSLKIDGEFVRNLTTSETDQVTVKAIVAIASGLGKTTVAEFVENEETLRMLESFGVDYVQGYHIGKPERLSAGPPVIRLDDTETPRIVRLPDPASPVPRR